MQGEILMVFFPQAGDAGSGIDGERPPRDTAQFGAGEGPSVIGEADQARGAGT
jgi:hypothetical protein